jgi:hypothetical protein
VRHLGEPAPGRWPLPILERDAPRWRSSVSIGFDGRLSVAEFPVTAGAGPPFGPDAALGGTSLPEAELHCDQLMASIPAVQLGRAAEMSR